VTPEILIKGINLVLFHFTQHLVIEITYLRFLKDGVQEQIRLSLSPHSPATFILP
jgi:hypothetical protein